MRIYPLQNLADGYQGKEFIDNLIRGDTVGFCFEAQNQTMAQYISCHGLYVIGADKVPAHQPGVRAGAAVQRNGRPGAAAIVQPLL